MSKDNTGKITKIIDNGNGVFSLEIVTTPNFRNYSERILNFELTYDNNANNFPFNVDDLVRFDEENISDMVMIPSADFDFSELRAFVYEAKEANEERIEELHKCLVGYTYDSSGKSISADEEFINMLLNYDFGKMSPVDMPLEYIKFFNSEYLSNFYITMLMKKLIIPNDITSVDLSEEKGLKDLTGEEWNILYETIKSNPGNFSRGQDFYNGLLPLAFQIDSNGARDFLNNYLDPNIFIKRIMYTSGLTPDASYYSGRGTLLSDVNQFTLFSIYQKLDTLDENKSLAMAELAYNMDTLGATEFITSLFNLVKADYDLSKINVVKSNISLDGTSREEALGILLISYAKMLGHSICRDNYLTRQIKLDFIDLQNKYLIAKYLDEGSEIPEEVKGLGATLRLR